MNTPTIAPAPSGLQQEMPIYDDKLRAELVKRIQADDIDSVLKMFVTKSAKAKEAIKEYNIETHDIMERSDKKRKNKPDYETNKLPRPWQRYINEIAVFFMFNNPIKIFLNNPKEEQEELKEFYEVYTKFIDQVYFNEKLREAKRIAGSETECAKYYQLYTDSKKNLKVKCRILSNSKEHELYTLFDKNEDLVAFGDKYYARNLNMEVEEHFDIFMDDVIYNCVRKGTENNWTIVVKENPIHKIPVIYFNQQKEWYGAERRIDRDEWLDSKGADTTEYFNDPYLKVSADIVNQRLSDAEEVGKAIKVQNADSVFEFVNPPQAGELQTNEKKLLKESILQSTFTPDYSYESIMGLGTLSGEAMRRMSTLGYIKRSMRLDIYNELIMRDLNLVQAILCNVIYLHDSRMKEGIGRLKLAFELIDPFQGSLENNSEEIQAMLTAGGMSIRTAVEMNSNVKDKDAEIERIFEEKKRLAEITSSTQQQQPAVEE